MAKIMTIRPPESLHQTLKQIANNRGYTLNQMILQILWDWVEQQKAPQSGAEGFNSRIR